MRKIFLLPAVLLISFPAIMGAVVAAEQVKRIDLTGTWKFNIDPENEGLSKQMNTPGYDGSAWRSINVPGTWRSQKITKPGSEEGEIYSGFGWYRRVVVIPIEWKGKTIFLNMGKTGGRDWTYMNGALIGHTEIGGERVLRSYVVPSTNLKFGRPNVVVVRIEGLADEAGILEGPVSLSADWADTPKTEVEVPQIQGSHLVRFGGDIRIEKDQTATDTVAILGSVTVAGHVTGDAVALGGTVTVLPGGIVDGNAVALFGNVRVMPGGKVSGDAVGIGGGVYRPSGAVVGGQIVNLGLGGLPRLRPTFIFIGYRGESALIDAINDLLYGVVFALLAAVLLALFPKRMEIIAEVAIARAGQSAYYGIVGLLIVIFGSLVLVGSCVGIPIAAAVVILAIAAWIFGKMAIGLALGRSLGDAVSRPMLPGVLAILVGTIVLTLIHLIPFVGGLVVWVLALIGFGAVLMTGFGISPTWWQDRRARKVQLAHQNQPLPEKPEA